MKTIGCLIIIILLLPACLTNKIKSFEEQLPDTLNYKSSISNPDSGNYETFLNKQFYNQCQDCNIISLKSSFNPAKIYIPYKLLRNIKPAYSVKCFDYAMKELLLSYFKSMNMMSNNIELLVGNNLLSEFNYDQSNFVPTYIYTRSCAGYLKAILDSEIEPPMSSIKNTLNADQENNSIVTILYGTFYSSIGKLLGERDNYKANYIYFRLFDVYLKDQIPIYYLKKFTGMSFNRITDQTAIQKLSSSIGLNVSAPIGSIAKVSSRIDVKTVLDNNEIFFGGFPMTLVNTKESVWEKLPDIVKTKEFLKNVIVKSNKSPIVNIGMDTEYEIWIEGVPVERCNKSYWKLDTKDSIELINVKSKLEKNREIPICLFTLKIKATGGNKSEDINERKEIELIYDSSIYITHNFNLTISADPILYIKNVNMLPSWKSTNSSKGIIEWQDFEIIIKSDKPNKYEKAILEKAIIRVNQKDIELDCSDSFFVVKNNEFTVKKLSTKQEYEKSDDATERVPLTLYFKLGSGHRQASGYVNIFKNILP